MLEGKSHHNGGEYCVARVFFGALNTVHIEADAIRGDVLAQLR